MSMDTEVVSNGKQSKTRKKKAFNLAYFFGYLILLHFIMLAFNRIFTPILILLWFFIFAMKILSKDGDGSLGLYYVVMKSVSKIRLWMEKYEMGEVEEYVHGCIFRLEGWMEKYLDNDLDEPLAYLVSLAKRRDFRLSLVIVTITYIFV